MKPDAPQGIRSLFQPIRTDVPGIDICDQMPLLARHTDKVAVVRSLTHRSNIHEPSVYHMLTGQQNPTLVGRRATSARAATSPTSARSCRYFSAAGRRCRPA